MSQGVEKWAELVKGLPDVKNVKINGELVTTLQDMFFLGPLDEVTRNTLVSYLDANSDETLELNEWLSFYLSWKASNRSMLNFIEGISKESTDGDREEDDRTKDEVRDAEEDEDEDKDEDGDSDEGEGNESGFGGSEGDGEQYEADASDVDDSDDEAFLSTDDMHNLITANAYGFVAKLLLRLSRRALKKMGYDGACAQLRDYMTSHTNKQLDEIIDKLEEQNTFKYKHAKNEFDLAMKEYCYIMCKPLDSRLPEEQEIKTRFGAVSNELREGFVQVPDVFLKIDAIKLSMCAERIYQDKPEKVKGRMDHLVRLLLKADEVTEAFEKQKKEPYSTSLQTSKKASVSKIIQRVMEILVAVRNYASKHELQQDSPFIEFGDKGIGWDLPGILVSGAYLPEGSLQMQDNIKLIAEKFELRDLLTSGIRQIRRHSPLQSLAGPKVVFDITNTWCIKQMYVTYFDSRGQKKKIMLSPGCHAFEAGVHEVTITFGVKGGRSACQTQCETSDDWEPGSETVREENQKREWIPRNPLEAFHFPLLPRVVSFLLRGYSLGPYVSKVEKRDWDSYDYRPEVPLHEVLNPDNNMRRYSGTGCSSSMLDSAAAWAPDSSCLTSAWMQMDLGSIMFVGGIVLQGSPDAAEWITACKVECSKEEDAKHECHASLHAKYAPGPIKLQGNYAGQHTKVTTFFDEPVSARFIRIYPTAYHGQPRMRAGVVVYGAPASTDTSSAGLDASSTAQCIVLARFQSTLTDPSTRPRTCSPNDAPRDHDSCISHLARSNSSEAAWTSYLNQQQRQQKQQKQYKSNSGGA